MNWMWHSANGSIKEGACGEGDFKSFIVQIPRSKSYILIFRVFYCCTFLSNIFYFLEVWTHFFWDSSLPNRIIKWPSYLWTKDTIKNPMRIEFHNKFVFFENWEFNLYVGLRSMDNNKVSLMFRLKITLNYSVWDRYET